MLISFINSDLFIKGASTYVLMTSFCFARCFSRDFLTAMLLRFRRARYFSSSCEWCIGFPPAQRMFLPPPRASVVGSRLMPLLPALVLGLTGTCWALPLPPPYIEEVPPLLLLPPKWWAIPTWECARQKDYLQNAQAWCAHLLYSRGERHAHWFFAISQ